MTLEDIKETKRYGGTDGRTHAHTDNVKTVYPPQTKFVGGIIIGWVLQRCCAVDMRFYNYIINIGLLV